jgi:hypothetical protein
MAGRAPSDKPATYADLEALPPNVLGFEGEEVVRAAPFDAIEIALGSLWKM